MTAARIFCSLRRVAMPGGASPAPTRTREQMPSLGLCVPSALCLSATIEMSMNTETQFDTLPTTSDATGNVARPGRCRHVRRCGQLHGRCPSPGTRPPIIGLTMQLWNQRRLPELQGDGPAQHRCCSLDDVYDAKRVAQHLNFPHYVVNFEHQFEERVVRPFVDNISPDARPSACTNCNTDVKFEPLLRMARQIGAIALPPATTPGSATTNKPAAWSCFAPTMTSKINPISCGGLLRNSCAQRISSGRAYQREVREAARRVNLPVAEKPDSMELCFVPNGNYVQFIHAYSRERGEPLSGGAGDIVNE